MPRADQVFIPNAEPTVTYVRRQPDYETRIGRLLSRRGTVVSLTGPSKSGKTILIQRALQGRAGCVVNCAVNKSTADIWFDVLRQLNIPDEEVSRSGQANTSSTGVTGGGGVAIPFVAQAGGSASATREVSNSASVQSVYRTTQARAIDSLIDRQVPIVVDDFHYLPRIQQVRLARQIKSAISRGLSAVICSVGYRSDDPIRANPDLQGRIEAIKLTPWSRAELASIGTQGFPALNAMVDPSVIDRLAAESGGSPLLMQLFCLKACDTKHLTDAFSTPTTVPFTAADLSAVFAESADNTDFTTVCSLLESGPRERRRRETYGFRDNSSGSIYVAILKAIALDPITPSLSYANIRDRVRRVCKPNDHPTGNQIALALGRMTRLVGRDTSADSLAREPVLEWLPHRDVLVLPDPYFLLYLRWDRSRSPPSSAG